MDKVLRRLAGWSAIITILAVIGGCSFPKPTQETIQSPTNNSSPETSLKSLSLPLPKTAIGIGQVASIKDKNLNVEFRVNGTREHQGEKVLQPSSGNKWILVNTTITNKGQKPVTFSVASFELTDSQNKQYDVALLAAALEDVKSPTGQINPGEQNTGEVPFEVPKSAHGLKLLFKPNSSDCEALAAQPKASNTINCEPIVVKLEN